MDKKGPHRRSLSHQDTKKGQQARRVVQRRVILGDSGQKMIQVNGTREQLSIFQMDKMREWKGGEKGVERFRAGIVVKRL